MRELYEAYLDVYEGFVPLTPDKEKRVQNRVGELVRDIQVSAGNVKSLRKKPFAKFRPKVKEKIASNISTTKKKHKLVQNASDALIRSSIDREAATRSKINKLKNQLGDLEGRNNIRKFQREELEYILDVLVSEGYVSDYDGAICILEAMGDEWIESILTEGDFTKGFVSGIKKAVKDVTNLPTNIFSKVGKTIKNSGIRASVSNDSNRPKGRTRFHVGSAIERMGQ